MNMWQVWVCAGALAVVGCGPSLDRPAARTSPLRPVPAFTANQASNALARVAALLALGPRDAGTPGAERAARWLADQLRDHGLPAARVLSFEDATPDGTSLFHNVVAEWPGTTPEWIVLLSHFDTKPGIGTAEKPFAGANDGGSSTGLLLELASVMVRSGPQRRGVLFAFLDGEECRYGYSERDGLHGSRRLASELKAQGRAVQAVILMDMIGDDDLRVTIPRNGTAALQLLALTVARDLGVRDRFSLLDGSILDDHQPFLDAGFPALDLIDFSYGRAPGENDYWHTPQDTLDKLSATSLHITGRVVMEMIRRLQAQ